jgi:hypothetical protein
MVTTFKRRIAKLESLRRTTGPKSLEDFLTEVQGYARRTGISLDEASEKFVPDLSDNDLRRFIARLGSAADVTERERGCRTESPRRTSLSALRGSPNP